MKNLFILVVIVFNSLSVYCSDIYSIDSTHRSISVLQADSMIQANTGNPDFVILDVRTPGEVANGYIANSININYYDSNFAAQLDALDHNKVYLIHCQSGGRSAQVYNMMISKHFVEFYNMLGGMNAWIAAGLPVVTVTDIAFTELPKNLFSVYPNPMTDFSSINCSEQGLLEIYNSEGRKICAYQFDEPIQIRFDKGNLKPGIYFANFRNSTNESSYIKIIVQ